MHKRNVTMMKSFLNNDNPAAEPLLAADKATKAKSSSDNGTDGEAMPIITRGGPLKTLALSVLACHTPAAVALTRSSTLETVHCSPYNTPNPSPTHQARKEMIVPPSPPNTYHGSPSQGRKSPSYRHRSKGQHKHLMSPTSIALKTRATTFPESPSSPPSLMVSDAMHKGQHDDPIQKSWSEGISHGRQHDHSHGDGNCAQEHEQKVEELKPSHVKNAYDKHRHKTRCRTSTCPEMSRSTIPATKPRERCSTGPVDIDELAGRDELLLSRAEYANAKNPPKDTTTMHRKLMSDGTGRAAVGLPACPERLDAERLLSQLGMDVTEEDYCLEGEFLRSNSSKDRRRQQTTPNRGRCHSYDCNYQHPLEGAYEDFGVERKLVELKNRPAEGWRHSQKKRTRGVRSMGKMVRRSLGSILNNTVFHGHGENALTQPSNSAAWKARVVSVLRGNKQSNRNRVPRQIVAAIAPTSSEDVLLAVGTPDDAPMTPDDMRLLYKWQTARTMRGGSGNEEGFEVPRRAGRRVAYPEDVLSITSSCGDKTTVMDNRRRRHRQGFSF